MTFRHLEAFVAIARAGCVTKAAEALLRTQPTLSGQIRELETEMGVGLFDRLPRGMVLTDAGKLFLPKAKEMIEARTRLLEEASLYRGALSGRLEINASTIPGEYILPPLLVRFARQYPGIRTRLIVHDSAEVIALVERGEASFGIVGRAPAESGLEFTPLWPDTMELYTAAGSGLPSEIALAALPSIPLVLREEGSGSRRTVESALLAAGLDPSGLNVLAELGSAAALREGVNAGLGAAFLSRVACARDLEAGLIRKIAVKGFAPVERRFFLAVNPLRAIAPSGLAFREFILCSDDKA